MSVSIEAYEEQQQHCNGCKSPSMEWCLLQKCPYWCVKKYTDKDREKYEHIMKRNYISID